MKKRHRRVYLLSMLDRIIAVETYVVGVSFEEFAHDRMRRVATEREIEIIGEAARNLGDEFMDLHPEVPWSKMIGMRNILIHDYMDIRLRLVWETATKSLPQLKAWLLENLGPGAESEL